MSAPQTTASRPSNGGFRAEELGRRDFQKQTEAIINRHAAAITELQHKLTANSEFMADMSQRIDEHTEDLADLREKAEVLRVWRNRGVLGRLRWMVWGQ